MVIKLKLEGTYGIQNEDIAKKNKYNSVQLTTKTAEDVLSGSSDDVIEISMATDSLDNERIDFIATNFKKKNMSLSGAYSSYMASVLYKEYTSEIDLSLEQYEALKTVKKPLPNSITFYGTKQSQTNSEALSSEFLPDATAGDLISWYETFDNVAIFDAIGDSWDSQYVITNNKYEYEEEDASGDTTTVEKDAYEEILSFSQNITSYGSLDTLNEYLTPKIIGWDNDSLKITLTMRIPYRVYFWKSDSVTTNYSTYLGYSFSVSEKDYSLYTINGITISLYNSMSVELEDKTYYDGKYVYSADESFLFSEKIGAGSLPSSFAYNIKQAYENGKLVLNIKCPVGNLVDSVGSPIVYIDGYGIARESNGIYFGLNGEVVDVSHEPIISRNVPLEENLMCIVEKNGDIVYKNQDNSIKYFTIKDASLIYTGILSNELSLAESISKPNRVVVMFSQSPNATISVTSSSDGDVISGYEVTNGATLNIYITPQYGYGLVENLININGTSVEKYANGYWSWNVDGDVIIDANIVYLGGKKAIISKSSEGCYLSVTASPVSGTGVYEEVLDGDELFTNQKIIIQGYLENGYSGSLYINGEEQQFEINSSNQNSFEIDYTVENDDLNIVLTAQNVQKTISLNADSGSSISATVMESKWNPASVGNSLQDGAYVCVGDYIQVLWSVEDGYELISYGVTAGATQIEYPETNVFEVYDNVVCETTTEQDISQFERKLYSSRIVVSSTVANIYSVNRISSLYDVPLGIISSVSDSSDSSGLRYYYPVYSGDVVEITATGYTGYAVKTVSVGPLDGDKTVLKTPTSEANSYVFEYTVSDSVEFVVAGSYMGATLTISGSGGTVRRTSSEYGGSISSLYSGSTIYIGDVIRVPTSSASVRVSNNLKYSSSDSDYDKYRFAKDYYGKISDATITFS